MFKPLGLKNTGMGVGEIKGKPVAFYYDPKTGKKHPPETLSIIGRRRVFIDRRRSCAVLWTPSRRKAGS